MTAAVIDCPGCGRQTTPTSRGRIRAHRENDGAWRCSSSGAEVVVAVAPTTLHAIRWEFDYNRVTATAVCHAEPGADCRLTSTTCECERWGEIQRRDNGTIWHKIVLDYEGQDTTEPLWHQVVPMDDCNVCLFINETGCVEELTTPTTCIDLGETPIKPVWANDGCDWEVAS